MAHRMKQHIYYTSIKNIFIIILTSVEYTRWALCLISFSLSMYSATCQYTLHISYPCAFHLTWISLNWFFNKNKILIMRWAHVPLCVHHHTVRVHLCIDVCAGSLFMCNRPDWHVISWTSSFFFAFALNLKSNKFWTHEKCIYNKSVRECCVFFYLFAGNCLMLEQQQSSGCLTNMEIRWFGRPFIPIILRKFL